MIIQLRIKNFLSIKEEIIFTTLASSMKEHEDNLFDYKDKKYLKSSVFYGANASGKTTFIKALNFMKEYVFNSNMLQYNQSIQVMPFAFNDETFNKPSEFDIIIVKDNIKYKYGFSVTKEKVIEEYLYWFPNGREKMIFERNNEEYLFPQKEEKKLNDIATKNTANKLFLTTSAAWNYELTKPVVDWFFNDLLIVFDCNSANGYTLDKFASEEKEYVNFILNLLNQADINISNIIVKSNELSFEEFSKTPFYNSLNVENIHKDNFKAKQFEVKATHRVLDKEYNLDFGFESLGTQNLFSLSAVLYDVLKNNKVLVIDELDKSLHPILVRNIISMFGKNNKGGAQLIFNTHDTNILDLDIFRRDQIWFVEKKYIDSSTHIYPLSDFSIRKNDNLAKGYLLGRYGAIPYIKGELWETED